MKTKFRYPTGTRPLLIEEAARRRRIDALQIGLHRRPKRRRIEARVTGILEIAGFAEVVLPILDFAEPYAGIPGRAERQTYRFTDRDGELVAIRSDFTPMVARALAPSLDAGDLPLRVFYRGDVIRCEASRLGMNRELFQIGAEIIGDASEDADREMLQLAVTLASELSADPLVVYADGPLVDDSRFVRHDEEGERGYYTGLRFWAYGDDRRTPIAQGGRYDSLYSRFGADAPAIGFTFTVN